VALSSARHVEHMDLALATSRLIGEAVGVVMSRYRLTEKQAWDAIRRASNKNNIKVRDLAEQVNRTGELPNRRR
jgi:AmiR/NasT family two-component response regulator